MRPYFRSIVLRIIITPFIVVILCDLPSPVFFGKKSPRPDHLQDVGSIFSLPRVNTEGNFSIFVVNCQAIEILKSKQCMNHSEIAVNIGDLQSQGRHSQRICEGLSQIRFRGSCSCLILSHANVGGFL